MSSFISEGKNVFDAVQKAIVIAGNPSSFSVKILKKGVESFFWWRKKLTVILFSYSAESKDKSLPNKKNVTENEYNKRKQENLSMKKEVVLNQKLVSNTRGRVSLERNTTPRHEDTLRIVKAFLSEANVFASMVTDFRLVGVSLSPENVLTISFGSSLSLCEGISKEIVFSSLTTLIYEFMRYNQLLKRFSIDKIIIT